MAVERSISTRIKLTGEKEFRKGMRSAANEVKNFGNWAEVMKGILSADALKTGFRIISDGIKAAVDASVEFESALAGIAKTTDMSAIELTTMGEDIKALAQKIPLSTTELAKLVEVGGQLGIPNENLLEFTETMANLGVATNLTSEQAATALAKLANIMGTSQEDYDRMGSSIVALGNNMATTEADITNMSERLAAAGKVVGLSEADIFALSATLSSLGIEAEAGGSAMSKLLKEIETMVATSDPKLTAFAKTAGMSADAFATAWQKDPVSALNAFVTGLGEMEKSGGNSIVMLEKLGVTEIRQSAAVLALANSGGLLADAIDLSNTAWEENTALSDEAAKRYATTESKLTLLQNSVNNMAIAVGDKLSPLLNGLMGGATDALQWLTTVISGEQDLRSLIADADKTYADTEEQMASAALQANALIDRLAELEGKPELTAAEQREWNASLVRLQEIMPSTTALIDKNTGAIDGGTAALRVNTAEAKRNALEVAKQAALQEKYEAYYLVAGKIADKQVELTLATRKATEAEQVLAKARARETALMNDAEKAAAELNEQLGYTATDAMAQLRYSDEYKQLQDELIVLAQNSYDASARVTQLTTEINTGNAQMEEAAATVREYEAALSSGDKAIINTTEAQIELTGAAKDQVNAFGKQSAALDTLIEGQKTAYTESLKQLDSVVKGFEKIDMPKAQSLRTTLKDLQSQLAYMDKYTKNLEKAKGLGLSDELTKELSDGSEKSAAILQGIVNDGGKNIDALNAKFAEISTGKEALATAMAEAQTDFTDKSDAIVAATNEMVDNFNQKDAAYSGAAETIQGVIDGMNSKLGALRQKYNIIRKLISASGSADRFGDDKPHAAGLSYVPYDNYGALLHRGEMVLTALEAKAYRAEQYTNFASPAVSTTTHTSQVYNDQRQTIIQVKELHVRDQQDLRGLAIELKALDAASTRGKGTI